jgi:nucleoside-diphosphate-sugar epimerase
MKIAIVGANGNVGTELCLYLRKERDIEVVPVVRNVLGSAYLRDKEFNCRVFDICSESEAEQALGDVDMVVISSYVFGPTASAYHTNRTMIDHSIRFAKSSSIVLYLSSIRAFAWRIDRATPRVSIPRSYDRNKRLLERHLLKACSEIGKVGIALRLGHVYGETQPRTKILQAMLQTERSLQLQVAPDAASNIVHTATIADCVKVCARSTVPLGVYSLVNVPQWSWKKVFDFYNTSGSELIFNDEAWVRKPLHRQAMNRMWKYVIAHRESLAELQRFMPAGRERKLRQRFAVQNARSQIAALIGARKRIVGMSEFAYSPMPGIFVPGLSETERLLLEDSLSEDLAV